MKKVIKKPKRKKQKLALLLCTIVVGVRFLTMFFAVVGFAAADRQ
jgi:uncharacterized membrane protein YwzB